MNFISEMEKDTSICADANITKMNEFIDDDMVNFVYTTQL